jgi:hypothetical protein
MRIFRHPTLVRDGFSAEFTPAQLNQVIALLSKRAFRN